MNKYLLLLLFLATSTQAEIRINVPATIQDGMFDSVAGQLSKLPPQTKVTVTINSQGGYLPTAIKLAEQLRRTDSVCVVNGAVASAAYLILLSCKERFYTTESILNTHWIVTLWTSPPPADMALTTMVDLAYEQGVWDGLGMAVTGMTYDAYYEFRNSIHYKAIKDVVRMSPNRWIKPVIIGNPDAKN